jgi:hypothetical protein
VISDDGGEFAKTVDGSKLARGRILDWSHIAMKFRAAERSVFGSNFIDSMERESVEAEIDRAKWFVWHGKGSKALERIKTLDNQLLAREGYEFKTLWWNLNSVSNYLKSNVRTLVNYGARHRKGLPISSSIAGSAVNQVVIYRMAKKRQMCWTNEGAHCMVQVRVALLNGEFSPRRISELKTSAWAHCACNGPVTAAWHRPTYRRERASFRYKKESRRTRSPQFLHALLYVSPFGRPAAACGHRPCPRDEPRRHATRPTDLCSCPGTCWRSLARHAEAR